MVCQDCRSGSKQGTRFCSSCGKTLANHAMPGGRLRWVGSVALLATSIWTGMAGGFGLYTRQVGVGRAWTALAVAFATIESGKLFSQHQKPHHPVKVHHAAAAQAPAASDPAVPASAASLR